MNKVNKVLLMLIAMVAIMLLAVGIDKGYDYLKALQWEKERVEIYEEARAEIESMQTTIEILSKDPEALTAYIEENELNYVEVAENTVFDNRVSESTVSDNTVSGNAVSGNTISGNTISGNTVSGNTISGNTISGNTISGNTVSGNTISGNTVSGNTSAGMKVCASYEETIRINQEDKAIIASNQIDFSDIKIACLGDSITEAANLIGTEKYEKSTYPYYLGECLLANEVVNLGIGGSSIGRYWENAFVDRYTAIPEDTDLIIVMGGTNDGFCASEKELGNLDERKPDTFVGDLDELLRGLKRDYPNATVVLVTPPPNVLQDMMKKDRTYLLPQSSFVGIMLLLAEEYEIPVIDIYHQNLLDTHDPAIIHNFMPDGVHGNSAGYQILAEHIAAEVIKLYENEME